MKSLQLSLTFYFWLLLAGAMGTASVLVYRQTESALQEKQDATAAMLQAKYDQDCHLEKQRVDDEMASQARLLAQLVQYQMDWARGRNWDLNTLGTLLAAQSPGGFVNVPLWLA